MYRKYILLAMMWLCGAAVAQAAEAPAVAHFRKDIQPILNEYCADCHEDGAKKGGIAFDEFTTDDSVLTNHTLWFAVLKNLRTGLMPPPKKSRPSTAEQTQIASWIKFEAFGLDPQHLDPGRITVRRLNRAEYRNTIRDLLGVEYDTETEFPPDDTGYGFDDIGDVLTLSPMLLEKYLDAAKTIVSKAVPMTSRVVAENVIAGRNFRHPKPGVKYDPEYGPVSLSFYDRDAITNIYHVDHDGRYVLILDLGGNERYVDGEFDYNKCRLTFRVDGHDMLQKDYIRATQKTFHYELATNLPAGDHELVFDLQPLTPNERQVRSLVLRIDSVTVRGPADQQYWMPPKNYTQYFPKPTPTTRAARRAYARELLGNFATKAFRRPVDDDTLKRLVTLAENIYSQPGKTFESGVGEGMIAVLASPRFLFREEGVESQHPAGEQPLVDEYALASRLSYFLWSSMPDEELFGLAATKSLRKNLPAQIKRMMADPHAAALTKNFTGQWLQARDVETVGIDSQVVLARDKKPDLDAERRRERFLELREIPDEKRTPEEKKEMAEFRARFRPPRVELNDELRRAMRQETEMYFSHIVKEDRSVVELVDSDYTFLNERLARHYGLTNLDITGANFRRVTLPEDSPRGGVLTMGTVLTVTSNPTRTSPVKRGLFILENILGSPTPPPPPNIPPLEASEKQMADHEPTLRQVLEIHREKPLCSSCHNRMDPLGLAFENFNALGMYRDTERGQPIDPAGKLITGEPFANVRELKHILATDHRVDFYRTLTEKMLTYALGRGLEYYDVETVDKIVDRLQHEDGKFSALLNGVIESTPFQERRSSDTLAQAGPFGHNAHE